MKFSFALIPAAALALCAAACSTSSSGGDSPAVSAVWTVENLSSSQHRQTFTFTGDLRGVKRICFNQFKKDMTPVNPDDSVTELLPGYYAIDSPRFAEATGRDTVVVELICGGTIHSRSFCPDGLHAVKAGNATEAVALTIPDLTLSKLSYTAGNYDRMPYGEEIFARNQKVAASQAKDVYDVLPSFKSVARGAGSSEVDLDNIVFTEAAPSANAEAYTITVGDGRMTVNAAKDMWPRIRRRIAHFFGTGRRMLPDAVISDCPDYGYRGLMIDVSRNFQPAEEIHKVLDLMAVYGLNVFHFHLIDDEGWRLEMPSLPECTEIGARRGYLTDYEADWLPQMYAGDGNPSSKEGTANGYYTQDEYIAILHHADSLGISVIPEIESPGHARAAVYAMKRRARNTGDESLLLVEPGDASVYRTAQDYNDNVMNPAMEGPYKLMEAAAREFIDIYARAGVELPCIHIGGDEVPHGAWGGSRLVAELMEREGFTTEKEVHAYFVEKVAEIYNRLGVKVAGWQDIGGNNSDAYNTRVAPEVSFVNFWLKDSDPKMWEDLAKGGYPLVLSSVNCYYLDMMYNGHPMERGLNWGGVVDEYTTLNSMPAQICKAPGANVLGVSGHVWAETIRSEADLENMLLPKMLGMAERAWNSGATYGNAAYSAVIESEMPSWDALGLSYHVNLPGIHVIDGGARAVFNSPYMDNTVIRCTFDGTIPTEESAAVKAGEPVDVPEGCTEIRARLWVNGNPSFTALQFMN